MTLVVNSYQTIFPAIAYNHDDRVLSFPSTVAVANYTVKAYWVSSGRRPELSAIPPDTPTELIDIMKRCWDGEPTKRPRFQGKIENPIRKCFKTVIKNHHYALLYHDRNRIMNPLFTPQLFRRKYLEYTRADMKKI